MRIDEQQSLIAVESVEEPDPFTLYLRELRAYPILSADEESHYISLAQNGDLSARNHMVNCNLRLVIKMARRFVNRGLSISDLVAEGNFGLFTAINKFKINLKYKFSTYATWWINQSIMHAIAKQARTIRIPIHNLSMVYKYIKTESSIPDSVTNKLKKVSEILNISIEETEWLDSISRDTVSSDQQGFSYNDSHEDYIKDIFSTVSFNDTLESDQNSSPEKQLEQENTKCKVGDILDILTEQERDIIFKRYGFESGRVQTLETISKKYKRTRERIRQIQDKAMEKLQKHCKENNIEMSSYL